MPYKLLFFSLISVLLPGCNKYLNDYQSPAPVYKSSTSYPYKISPVENHQSVETENSLPFEESKSPNALSDGNSKQLSPAVLALVADADKSSEQGKLDSAVITLERALRIDSRNPFLIYKLAKLRLDQLKPRLAEDLAKKAALLSANDKTLKKHCWLLISKAREQQNNHYGANEAKERARNIFQN